MSCYEGMNGKGRLSVAEFKALNVLLIDLLKADLNSLKENAQSNLSQEMRSCKTKKAQLLLTKEFKELEKQVKKEMPNSRTTSFGVYGRHDIDYCVGCVNINKKERTFSFEIEYNNHSLETARETQLFRGLERFIYNLPKKKANFVEVKEYDEYDRDRAGDYSYYGG